MSSLRFQAQVKLLSIHHFLSLERVLEYLLGAFLLVATRPSSRAHNDRQSCALLNKSFGHFELSTFNDVYVIGGIPLLVEVLPLNCREVSKLVGKLAQRCFGKQLEIGESAEESDPLIKLLALDLTQYYLVVLFG